MKFTHPPRAHLRRVLSLLVAFALSMGLTISAGLLTPTVATAAGGWVRGPGYNVAGSMVGYWVKGGTEYICLDTHLPWPSSVGGASGKGTAEINYLMAKYLNGGASDTTAAALAIIVKDRYDDQSGAWKALRRQFFAGGHGAVKDRISDLLAEAKKYAGPYTITPVVGLDVPAAGATSVTGKVTNIGVLSAGKQWMTEDAQGDTIKLKVTLSAGTFSDGSTSKIVDAASSGISLDIVALIDTDVVATVDPQGADMAASKFDKHAAVPSGTQNMSRYNLSELKPGSSAAKVAKEGGERSIVLDSQVRTAYVRVGDTISDHVHVVGQWTYDADKVHREPVTVTSTLYGPFTDQPESSADVPAGAPVVQTFTEETSLDAGNPGVPDNWWVFTSNPLSQPGYYVWVETAVLDNYADTSEVTSQFGRPWETSYVAQPSVTSQVMAATEDGKTVISDRVTVSGLKAISGASYDAAGGISDGPRVATPLDVTLTGKLLGPMSPVGGSCDAVNWGSAPTALNIDGIDTSNYGANATTGGDITWYEVGRFTSPEVGKCYTYTYTFKADSISWAYASGTGVTSHTVTQRNVFSIDLAAGDPTETTVQYALSSKVGAQLVTVDGTSGDTTGTKSPADAKTSSDTVSVDGLPAGATITVESTLYGPIKKVAGGTQDTPYADGDNTELLVDPPVESWTYAIANPELAPVVKTYSQEVTGDASGHQEVTFTSPELTADGWYVWVESSAGIPGKLAPYTTTFGRTSESTVRITPAVGTKVSAQRIVGDQAMTDTVTVGGVELTYALAKAQGKEATVTLSGVVYGSEAPWTRPGATPKCDDIDWTEAKVAATIAAEKVLKDGTITGFGKFTPGDTTPACYTYAETLTATIDGTVVWEVTHTPGKASQTSLVTIPKMVTQTSVQVTGPGQSITDKITVTGLDDNKKAVDHKGTISAILYGPLTPPVTDTCTSITTEAWNAAVKDKTTSAHKVDDILVDGNGDYTTAAVTLAKPGCYTWWEKLTVGDKDKPTYTTETPLGVVQETTLAKTPTMVTQTSALVTGPGASVTDKITVTGNPKGTIEAILYGPYAVTDALECSSVTTEAWNAAIKANTVWPYKATDIVVNGDGDYTTSAVTVPSVGCYTWWEKLTVGDKDKPTWSLETPPGTVSETTLVIQPAVSTIAKSSKTSSGVLLTDDVLVTGMHGTTGTVTGSVLGPLTANTDKTCTGLDWTVAPIAGQIEPLKVTGDGTYTTKAVKVNKTGCYTFVETLTPDTTGVPVVNTQPGIPAETLYVTRVGNNGTGDNTINTGLLGTTWTPWMLGLGAILALGAVVLLIQYGRKVRSE